MVGRNPRRPSAWASRGQARDTAVAVAASPTASAYSTREARAKLHALPWRRHRDRGGRLGLSSKPRGAQPGKGETRGISLGRLREVGTQPMRRRFRKHPLNEQCNMIPPAMKATTIMRFIMRANSDQLKRLLVISHALLQKTQVYDLCRSRSRPMPYRQWLCAVH